MNLGVSGVAGIVLDSTTKDDLDGKFTAIQHGWLVEHALDGSHTPAVSRGIIATDFFASTAAADFLVFGAQPRQTFLYSVRGNRMWVQLMLRAFNITNTPPVLKVLIPDGWTASHDGATMGWAIDNGTYVPMAVEVNADVRHIFMYKVPIANWANATGTSSLGFTFEFNVRR